MAEVEKNPLIRKELHKLDEKLNRIHAGLQEAISIASSTGETATEYVQIINSIKEDVEHLGMDVLKRLGVEGSEG